MWWERLKEEFRSNRPGWVYIVVLLVLIAGLTWLPQNIVEPVVDVVFAPIFEFLFRFISPEEFIEQGERFFGRRPS